MAAELGHETRVGWEELDENTRDGPGVGEWRLGRACGERRALMESWKKWAACECASRARLVESENAGLDRVKEALGLEGWHTHGLREEREWAR